MNSAEQEKGIRSLQRAIDILNCFTIEENELSLTEISKKINLAKSTVIRLLYTLELNNFVERDPSTFKYKLGKQLYFIGNLAGRSIEIRSVAKATMEKLRDQTRETVNLYVLENDSRICIQQFESLQSVRHAVRIGEKLPLTLGATGKVLLAYQANDYIENIYNRESPKRSKEDLKEELQQIVDERFAKSIDEREVGSSAIATPIFDVNGNVIAALSISGPTVRFKEEAISKLKKQLIDGGIEISANLGFMKTKG
ncbi:IclR family transcriptional regulator [Bacillus timonensis]|uniref:Glycerol operon regulatory protein n=1 Tax=Bacillus timonensis TaxID=1033734 RepID=A0A4S3PN21_9BACI|nr:IclR family transcriptional regulator [Bacillus timonensis]THE10515.1 IclR family transcriptional regulator [Bacillus timonensis]